MRLTHSYRSARNAKIRRSHRLSIGAIETLEARRLMAVGIDEISLDWQTHQPIRDVLPMSDGSLWFTGYNDGNGVQNGVWRRSPSGAVSSVTALDDLLQPDQILQGPDGAIWVMSGVYGQNGQVTKLKDNVATHFDMHGDPNSMAIGADGTLWVAVGKTDYGWSSNPAIVRVTPDGSVRSAVSLDATPTNLIAGITGDLWFDQSASGILGHLTSDGVIATYAIPNDFGPNSGQAAALAVGPDGSLWLSTRSRTGNAATLVHLATDGTSVSMPLDPRSNVTSLIPAADGSIWYTDSGLDAVGKLATNGQITAIPTPTDQTTPFGLTSDGSRGFWYVAGASKFGHVVTNLPEPMITVTNLAFTATEGPITSDTIIASFTTTDLTATAADFVSRVDFGTATSQSRNGEIRAAGPGEFVVLAPRGGSNAYGTALMTVTILDAKHHNAVGASSTILGVANFDVILPVIVGRFNAVPARSNTSVFVAEVSDASVTGTSTMTIDWGDGTTSDGSASTWGLNQYWVMGTHSYATPGTYTVTTTVKDNGHPVVATSMMTVTPATLVTWHQELATSWFNEGALPSPAENLMFTSGIVNANASDFSAFIEWGDGTSSVGSVVQNGVDPRYFYVMGNHTYGTSGSYTSVVRMHATGGAADDFVTTRLLNVLPAPILTENVAQPVDQGAAFRQPLIKFRAEGLTNLSATDFTATIDWQDGSAETVGTIESLGDGAFQVVGSHIYNTWHEVYGYSIMVAKVTITRPATQTVVDAQSIVEIVPKPDPGFLPETKTLTGTAGSPISAVVASFFDPARADIADYTATIEWGDGVQSAGTVSSYQGQMVVYASHTYANSGSMAYVANVSKAGFATVSASGTVKVAAKPVVVVPPPVVITPPAKATIVSAKAYAAARGGASIALVFSGAADAKTVADVSRYKVTDAGKDGKLGTKDDRVLQIKSAKYDATTKTLSLTPKGTFSRKSPFRVSVRGESTLTAAWGH